MSFVHFIESFFFYVHGSIEFENLLCIQPNRIRKTLNRSIRPIDGTLTDTTPTQSGNGSNVNNRVPPHSPEQPNIYVIIIFTNPSARAGYDTRSIFKRSLTGLNSVFLLRD